MRRAMLGACGLLLALGALSGAARAATTGAERATARKMLDTADEAFEERRYAEALELYSKAHAIMRLPTTGLAVAQALVKLGRLIESRQVALWVVQTERVADEPAAFETAREQAKGLLWELQNATPTLQVVVRGLRAGLAPALTLDGSVVQGDAGRPLVVDPGEHEIRVHAGGYRQVGRRVTLVRGDRQRVEVKLEPVVQREPGPGHSAGQRVPTLAYVGFGLGAAGILTGSVTGLLSLSKASAAKDQCDGNDCPAAAKPDADSSKSLAWVSNVSFGIGVVAAGVGMVSLLTSGSSEGPKAGASGYALDVAPAPGGAGIRIVGRF